MIDLKYKCILWKKKKIEAYPDLDGRSSGGAEPVPVGTEAEAVDGVGVVQSVEVLVVIEVPEHGLGILATRGTQRTVRGNSYGVEVPSVPVVVSFELAVSETPHLPNKDMAVEINKKNGVTVKKKIFFTVKIWKNILS